MNSRWLAAPDPIVNPMRQLHEGLASSELVTDMQKDRRATAKFERGQGRYEGFIVGLMSGALLAFIVCVLAFG